jgi:serine/threonine-protein kinase
MPFFCIHCKSEIDPQYKACPYCGDPITDFLRRYLEMPLDGKYQILDRLGVGGMGEVYKVLHTHLNAIRVIKLMRSNIAADTGAHDRFLREARLATKIQHPNVATLFDFSTLDDGSNYMVWEYIEGINLHELIDQRGPLSPRYAAKLSAQALLGLDAIHRAGIVHRDISPENLMITRDDEANERVKIIDLGIAKSSGAEDNKTKTGMFVGKWKYCSPEHLGMLPPGERIDGRADLYSFGIVLYEMLVGVPPFQADTPHRYLMMHASERPRPLREVNPGVVDLPQLETLIFRALEKDRNLRFASAREFAQELERIAPALPDAPGAPPPVPISAEITDEATREARMARDAATIVSIEGNAPTVATPVESSLSAGLRPASGGVGGRPEAGATRHRSTWIYAAAVILALMAAGGWMLTRDRPQPPAPKPAPPIEARMAIPVAQGRVGINAFPWAEVTSVKNIDNGQSVDIGANVVTPAPLDLAPGRYEVTLSNPNFAKPITRTISLAPGTDETLWVSFSDPASASVPDFGAAP